MNLTYRTLVNIHFQKFEALSLSRASLKINCRDLAIELELWRQ